MSCFINKKVYFCNVILFPSEWTYADTTNADGKKHSNKKLSARLSLSFLQGLYWDILWSILGTKYSELILKLEFLFILPIMNEIVCSHVNSNNFSHFFFTDYYQFL